MDRLIEVRVNGSYLSKDTNLAGTQYEANARSLRITFDEGWDNFAKSVTWWNAKGENPTKITLTTNLLENAAESMRTYIVPIPGEAMTEAGENEFVIDGYYNGVRQRSVGSHMKVDPSPYDENAGAAQDPTPTQAEQIQAQIEDLKDDIQKSAQAAELAEQAIQSAEAATNAAEAAMDAANIVQSKVDAAQAAAQRAEKAQSAVTQSASKAESASAEAQTAAQSASASAQAAQTSASNALASAETAESEAKNAEKSAQNAQNAVTSVQTSATNASASASQAAQSASAAKTSETNASKSASGAAQSASAASTSATNAAGSATAAAKSAGSAQTSATNASDSAYAADAASQNAYSYAQTAYASAQAAQAAKDGITTAEQNASNSAASAAASKDAAQAAQAAAERARDEAQDIAGGNFASTAYVDNKTAAAESAANAYTDEKVKDIPETAADVGAVALSGGRLYTDAGLSFSKQGGSMLTVTGNAVALDMRAVTGGWTTSLLYVTDATNKNTMVLGVKGNASGLSQVLFGGSASDPLVKLTADGQLTLKMKPLVGTETLATLADIGTLLSSLTASDVGAAEAKIGVVNVTESTTLALTHAERTIRVNASSAATLTIPTNASVAFPIGTCIVVTGVGAGAVSFTPASGVTLNSKDGKRSIDGQYAAATLYQSEANVWELWGALA